MQECSGPVTFTSAVRLVERHGLGLRGVTLGNLQKMLKEREMITVI